MPRRSHEAKHTDTPLYCLDTFSERATASDFYIQKLKDHLREHPFVSMPHKHDFYLILCITQGSGKHSIDFTDYPVGRNSFFVMTPGQVHSWQLSKDTDGIIVFFTKEFYQLQSSENNLMDFPFYHSLTTSPAFSVSKPDVVMFALHQMMSEYGHGVKPNIRLLRTYLDLLLLELSKYTQNTQHVATRATTLRLRRLEQLIDENFASVKQPSGYASMMNLSASYLNTICKDNLGKTLSDLIQQRVIIEAKRLFAYTDMNVNEVAAKLNYQDASYFVRLFRKNTGQTPEQFKASLHV